MVIYPDLAFLLNSLADFLALSATAWLAGLPLRWRRILGAALLGGLYGAACLLPQLAAMGGILPQAFAAAGLVWVAFRRKSAFLRQLLLFWLLSCALGGVLLAVGQLLLLGDSENIWSQLNWKVFFLAGGICYILLSVIFRGGASHAMAKEITPCCVTYNGKSVRLSALLDTGHTLTDAATGSAVLIAEGESLDVLWTPGQQEVLGELRKKGPVPCLEALQENSDFRLLPYRAVGVSSGMLLCFTADNVRIGDTDYGPITVALSPTPVSDGGGYTALWGASKGRTGHAA